jgi:hypothetical protein
MFCTGPVQNTQFSSGPEQNTNYMKPLKFTFQLPVVVEIAVWS